MNQISYNVKAISESEIAQKTAHLVIHDILDAKVDEEMIASQLKAILNEIIKQEKYRIIVISCFSHLNRIIEAIEYLSIKEIFQLDKWPTNDGRSGIKKFYHIDTVGFNLND